ncbi:MAG: HEAT repeat domain-containing protein [Myxococcota bacterium]
MSDENTRKSRGLIAVAALALVAACAGVATTVADEPVREAPAESVDEVEQRDRVLASIEPIEPPAPGDESWSVPDAHQTAPPFPYLPGEDHTVSRSVGDVSSGYLINARPIEQPHPRLALLPVQYKRGLHYTSDQLYRLIDEAARHVAATHDGAVTWLGNLSAPGGGDIPYSVSHNSGRDADLAFFLVDEDGKPVVPEDLVPIEDDGTFESEDGEVYHFDAERNWTLIEGLVRASDDDIQYIFVSDALRRMLLTEARRRGASRSIIARAERILHQPGGALPHNDHFHVRVYCSETDVRSGCEDFGRRLPGYESYGRAWRETAKNAAKLLDSDDPAVRVAALDRLGLLDARRHATAVERALADSNPRVRAASARALADLGRGTGALAKRLEDEENAYAVAEIVNSLSRLGGNVALQALMSELDEPRPLAVSVEDALDIRSIVAEGLIALERGDPVERLIGLLASSDNPGFRAAILRTLRFLTNHRFTEVDVAPDEIDAELAEAWQTWFSESGHQAREEWLAAGFRQAGYDVRRIRLGDVWELCRAVDDSDYLSYNAQRSLMRLAGRQPASLSWPKHDANFYWRRWFERRWKRLGAPPVPEGMSTLD